MVGKAHKYARCSIVLTGTQEGRRYRVKVQNRPASLTVTQITALCQLIAACTRRRAGLVLVLPVTIMRLRNAIDRATGRRGTGKTIIQTAGGSRYVFGLPLTQVGLDPSFRELPAPGVITVEEHRAIMRRCAWL